MDISRPFLDTTDALAQMLGPLAGRTAVDLGAGSGGATRALAALGARAIGVEPNAEARRQAEAEGGGPTYRDGTGAASGLPDRCADLVLFSMSLHHCPDMGAALNEALRVLRPGGHLAVLEPEAGDPLWPVVRWIDDETAVYAEAQTALEAVAASGRLEGRRTLHYAVKDRTESAEALIDLMISVDPSRAVAEDARRKVGAAFAAARQEDDKGGFIPYWLRLDVFDARA
ncbi:MAG: class I SAM-dependent methyltransferase [Pseudomonadota bacterium]